MTNKQKYQYIGIDAAKKSIEVDVPGFSKKQRIVKTSSASLESLARHLATLPNCLVIIESTGGYEWPVIDALHTAGVQFARVNPRKVRFYAKAEGVLAKTDRIDSKILTSFGQKFRVTPQKMPSKKQRELFEFSQYRKLIQKNLHRVEMQLEHEKSANLLKLIRRQVRTLKNQLAAVEKEIKDLIASHPPFKAAYDAFTCVKGVGPATALAMLAYMPEIGSLSRRKLAALAGVAPMNNDSGEMKGRRTIQGGRANFRRQLYMAALVGSRHNPILKEHYQSLLERGMKKKCALVSVMRKLLSHLNSIAKNLLSEQNYAEI